MRRSADDPARLDRPDARGGRTALAQVHPVSPGGQRHIRTVVHEHARRPASRPRRDARGERRERTRAEITLADLNHIHTGVDRVIEQRFERHNPVAQGRAELDQLPAIGDQTDDRPRPRRQAGGPPASERRTRDRVSNARKSAMPATSVTSPTSATPPRTTVSDIQSRSQGTMAAKKLRSHSEVHGATRSTRPASIR